MDKPDFILLSRFTGVGGERQRGWRDEIFDWDFEIVDFVVVNGEAIDDGFLTKATDLNDEFKGRLGMSVAECVI